jgi:uncharacterized protein YbjT (DUF2867 family)
MILVAGATGNVGAAVVRALASAGEPVRAVVRQQRRETPVGGDDIVQADLNDRGSMMSTYSDVQAAFLLAGYSDMPGMLADMKTAGVQRIVLLSTGAVVGGDLDNAVVRFNVVSEAAARDSDLGWTVLRPSGFMSNTLQWVPQLRESDEVLEPFADVPIALIDPDDIAAVAVAVLLSPHHDKQSYRLTGPATLLPADRALILSDVLGRRIRLRAESDDDARRRMAESMPDAMVDSFFQFFRRGGYDDSRVNTVASDLLGRPLLTFRDWAERHADSFR